MEEQRLPITVTDVVIKELKKTLAKLEALPPVPVIGSPEYKADPEGYRKQVQMINDLHRDAEVAALVTIPESVKAILEPIIVRRVKLLHIGEPKQTP